MSGESREPIIHVDNTGNCEDGSCLGRVNIEMKPDQACLSTNSVEKVADGCEEEFHLNRNDLEIGVAITLRGSSLNDLTSGKQQRSHVEFWRQYSIYIILVFMGLIITGLSVEIAKLNRRRSYKLVVTQMPSWQPSTTPSTTPSVVPSYSPSLSNVVSNIFCTCCNCCSSLSHVLSSSFESSHPIPRVATRALH